MKTLAELSDDFHAEGLPLDRLPEALDAGLVVRPGGTGILGLALVEPVTAAKVVALNTRVVGTPLERPILAHQCAHLALPDAGGPCSLGAWTARGEREAWSGAAILLVPSFEAALVGDGRATPESLAGRLGVAVPFVHLRLALGPALGERAGGGRTRDLEEALGDLRAWVESEVRALIGPRPARPPGGSGEAGQP